MAPLCGKPLSPADRKVWTQAIKMIMGLKVRNGLGEDDLAAAVGTALRRKAVNVARKKCEDCQLKHAEFKLQSDMKLDCLQAQNLIKDMLSFWPPHPARCKIVLRA